MHVDFAELSKFVGEFRTSSGWLLTQCGIPFTAAMSSAQSAVSWPDHEPGLLGTRWDREVSELSNMLRVFATAIDDTIEAFEQTDQNIKNS